MNCILYTHSCFCCCRLWLDRHPSTGSWFSPKHSGVPSSIPRSSSHPLSFSEFPLDSALSITLACSCLLVRRTRPRNCISPRMPTSLNLCTHEQCFSFLSVSFARDTLLLTLV